MAYNEKWILESPLIMGEREGITLTIVFPDTTSATITDAGLVVYNGTVDVTSTVASGSNTASGNRVTLKKISGLTGGQTYVCSILVTVDGLQDEYKLQINCIKSSDEVNGRWVNKTPLVQLPRSSTPWSISFTGATTVSASETDALEIYRNGTDVTSTYASGVNSVSGNVVTTKTINSLAKGTYVCSLLAAVDGQDVEVKWILKTPESFDQQ